MTEELMHGIYRITIPLPKNPLRELNCYLIRGAGRNLLIDTGFRQDECREALLRELKLLGISMEETDILLTHLHSDHTGLAPEIASRESRVYIGAADREWLMKGTRGRLKEKEELRYAEAGLPAELLAFIGKTHPGRAMAPDPEFDKYECLQDGDVLTVDGDRLEVIETPGHTPSHLCLWMEEQGVMFTGDHILFEITPNITSFPDVDDALGDYLDSLRRIRKYPVRRALPAHRAEGDFHLRIDELLQHHESRLNECLQVICREPGATPFEIAGQMTWRISAKDWESFPISQKWFAVGECFSHLDRLQRLGRVYFQNDSIGVRRYYPTE